MTSPTARLEDSEGNVIKQNLNERELRALQDAGCDIEVSDDIEPQEGGGGNGGGVAIPDDDESQEPQEGDGETGDAPDDEGDESEPQEGSIDPQELAEMQEMDDERESGEWHGAGGNYEQTPDSVERRYAELLEDDGLRLDERRRRRDAAAEQKPSHHWDHSEKVKATLRQNGLDREIEDAFRQIKSRGVKEPAYDRGHLNTQRAGRRMRGLSTGDKLRDYSKPAEPGDRVVGVAFDLSGSMDDGSGGGDLHMAKVAFAALATATTAIGDDLVAAGFTTYGARSNRTRAEREYGFPSPNGPIPDDVKGMSHKDRKHTPCSPLVLGPDEDFSFDKLNGVNHELYTPTSEGIAATKALMDQCGHGDKVLIVLTDGEATHTQAGDYSGQKGKREAKSMVSQLRDDDWTVLGMAVGSGVKPRDMDDVFNTEHVDDAGWVHANSESLVDELVSLYKSQMKTV